MIMNLSGKIYEIMEILESDGAVLMKIMFNDRSAVSNFTKDYLSTSLNPVWYNTYSKFVIISLTADFGLYAAYVILSDILLSAAQDYDAIKIQLI